MKWQLSVMAPDSHNNILIILLFILCIPLAGKAQDVSLQELVYRKQYNQVIAYADQMNPADSIDYHIIHAIAQAYEGMLKYRDAYRYYQLCFALDSANIDVLNALARTATNLGKASDAERYFRKVLSTDSTNFYANYQLARLHYQLADYSKAIGIYEFLLEQDDTNPTLLKNIGDCYSRMGDPLAALASYFLAYGFNRENTNLASTLINYMLRVGGDYTEEAIAVCDTALSYNPDSRLLRQNKGMTLYINKKYAEADTLYSGLLAEGDSTYLTLKYGGASRYYAGQFMNSIDPLEAAYLKDTTSVEVCLLLGSSLGKTYDRKRAYELLDKAEKNMQPSPYLVTQLTLFRAETLQKDGRYAEAAPLYYITWKQNPKRLDLLWNIGTFYSAKDLSGYKTENDRQRALFIHTLYAQEFLKTKENPVNLIFHRRILNTFYEDAFFRNITELPMLAPDGKKSKISMTDLRALIDQIPEKRQE